MAARPPAPHHGSTETPRRWGHHWPPARTETAHTRPHFVRPPGLPCGDRALATGKAVVTAALDLLSLPMSTRLV